MPGSVAAYVLVETEVNAARVAEDIRKLEGVESADDVSGPYDIIVRVSARSMDELGRLVVTRLQGIQGITRTLTCPIVQL